MTFIENRRRRGITWRATVQGLAGLWREWTGSACGAAANPHYSVAWRCDKSKGHADGICMDRRWIGGLRRRRLMTSP